LSGVPGSMKFVLEPAGFAIGFAVGLKYPNVTII
jgi:hypothetical protein